MEWLQGLGTVKSGAIVAATHVNDQNLGPFERTFVDCCNGSTRWNVPGNHDIIVGYFCSLQVLAHDVAVKLRGGEHDNNTRDRCCYNLRAPTEGGPCKIA